MPELPAFSQQRAQDLPRTFHWANLIITSIFTLLSILSYQCQDETSNFYGYCYSEKKNPNPYEEIKDDNSNYGNSDLATILRVLQIICFLLYFGECYQSASRAYLKTDMEIPELENYLKRIKASAPQLGARIECYHYANWQDGKEDLKKVTYVGTSFWNYRSWSDNTGEILGMTEGKMIKLEVEKSHSFGNGLSREEYEVWRRDYINNNANRDKRIKDETEFEIGGFQPYVLVQNKGAPRPCCMSGYWYWFWSILFLSWFYRLWFEHMTVNKKIEVKKVLYGWKGYQETVL